MLDARLPEGWTAVSLCGACPDDYDIKDASGTQVGYLRYRWGYLSAWYPDYGQTGECVYGSQIGDEYDGVLTEQHKAQAQRAVDAIVIASADHLIEDFI